MMVHWLMQKWEQVPESLDWLHADEKKFFSRFRFMKKQQDWLLGRWTAKQLILHYCESQDITPAELSILPASDGAPQVFFRKEPFNCNISLSHSNGLGLCVFTSPTHKIGCDLEKVEPRSSAFIQDYFTQEEQLLVEQCQKNETSLMANLIWSAKESVMKALRTGLSIDTREVNIVCSTDQNVKIWQDFDIILDNYSNLFYGKWIAKSGMVITIISDVKDFSLQEHV